MNKYIKRDHADANQKQIVKDLQKIGCYVLINHDDLLVYYNGKLFQIELKVCTPFNKNGTLKKSGDGSLKKSQKEILERGNDNYAVCWSLKHCYRFINGIEDDYLTPSKYKRLNK